MMASLCCAGISQPRIWSSHFLECVINPDPYSQWVAVSCSFMIHNAQLVSYCVCVCLGTEEVLAYGKHHYRAFQAGHESALVTEALSARSHPLSTERGWPSSSCCRERELECLALTFRKCLTFNSAGNQRACIFYSLINNTWLAIWIHSGNDSWSQGK